MEQLRGDEVFHEKFRVNVLQDYRLRDNKLGIEPSMHDLRCLFVYGFYNNPESVSKCFFWWIYAPSWIMVYHAWRTERAADGS